jgi:hypothetical protein
VHLCPLVPFIAACRSCYRRRYTYDFLSNCIRCASADIFHFPLPFRLHFEATVHAITCAIEIITTWSVRPSVLLVPHYYAIRHALLPSYTSYGLDARQNAGFLATWPQRLTCAWLPTSVDWPVVSYLKTHLRRLRDNQVFTKSMASFRALIRRRLDERWAEDAVEQKLGSSWLNVRVGLGLALPGRRHKGQYLPFMTTPQKAVRFTYAMTGHAPIGAYQKRFKIRENDECPRCQVPQTRDHVLSACGRYTSVSLHLLFEQRDSVFLLADFLLRNPLAFTFAHAPFEPP